MGNQFVSFRLPPADIEVLEQAAVNGETVSSVVKRLALEFVASQRKARATDAISVITSAAISDATNVETAITAKTNSAITAISDTDNTAISTLVNQDSKPVNHRLSDDHLLATEASLLEAVTDASRLRQQLDTRDGAIASLQTMAVALACDKQQALNGLLAYDAECDRLTREKIAAETENWELAEDIGRLDDERERSNELAVLAASSNQELREKLEGVERDKLAAIATATALEKQLEIANRENEELRRLQQPTATVAPGEGLLASVTALTSRKEERTRSGPFSGEGLLASVTALTDQFLESLKAKHLSEGTIRNHVAFVKRLLEFVAATPPKLTPENWQEKASAFVGEFQL